MPTPNEIRDLVEKDRFELMMRCPFYGRIICSEELVVVSDPRVKMACTDYRRIFISADAYPKLPEEKRLAVLAHEVLHIALRHAFRVGDRNKTRFEMAADIEVHFLLIESFPDPYGIKGKEEWKDLTAEQIYELLPPGEKGISGKSDHCDPDGAQAENELPTHEQQDGNGHHPDHADNQLNGGGDDKQTEKAKNSKHSKKDNGRETSLKRPADNEQSGSNHSDNTSSKSNQGSEKISKNNPGGKPDDKQSAVSCSGNTTNGCDDEMNNRNEDLSDNGGMPSGGDDPEEKFSEFLPQFDSETKMDCTTLSSEMLMDLKLGVHGPATSSSVVERLLQRMDKPRVSWRAVLRQFIRICYGGSYSWTYPNRRFISRGLYLPGRHGLKSFSGIVALDTSPSTKDALPRFVSELTGLLKAFGKYDLTIIECAARILQVWQLSSDEPNDDISRHRFMGDWGTDFTPVFQYIVDHRLRPNVLIYFTDGEGDCPKERPSYPVIWMLTKGGTAPVSWGHAINYEEEN